MIYIPKISPLPFTQVVTQDNKAPDLGGKFVDVDYQDYYSPFKIGDTLVFQFYSDTLSPTILAGDTSIIPINITPTGWSGTGNYVLQVSYIIPDSECFQVTITEGLYIFQSVLILPVDDINDYVRVDYKNSESDYGYITTGEYLTVFLIAEYKDIVLGNEKDTYQNDRGGLSTQRSTPTEAYELNIDRSPRFIGNMINMIFSCDDILINSQPFQTSEVPSSEPIEERSNLFNYSVIIQRIEDDYNFFTILMGEEESGGWIWTDGTNNIFTDNTNAVFTGQ